MAIPNGLMRWKYWKEMFGKKKTNVLDKSEKKGLIGELLELRDFYGKNGMWKQQWKVGWDHC